MLLNCCSATLPILYKAQEPAAKTGVNTMINLISIIFFLKLINDSNIIVLRSGLI